MTPYSVQSIYRTLNYRFLSFAKSFIKPLDQTKQSATCVLKTVSKRAS